MQTRNSQELETVIIDVNSFAYNLSWKAEKQGLLDVDITLFEQYVKLNCMYMISGACLNTEHKERRYLWVGDSKPYWRYEELKRFNIAYKGKKSNKNYRYKTFIPLINTYIESFLAKNNIYVMFIDGFEADDLAASYVKLFKEPTNVITTDYDWLPLCDENHVRWLSMTNSYNRICDKQIALSVFRNDSKYNSTKEQRAYPKNSILDLWRFKAIFGDKSDNIPGDKSNPEKFLPYIDLFTPHQNYDLKWQPGIDKLFKQYISKPLPQVNHKQYISKVGNSYDMAIDVFNY